METFYLICQWGLILAFVCLVGALVFLGMTALRFKTAVIGHAKRLYERPVNSAKSLAATGKALVQQEQVRVKHMAGTFQGTAGDVKEAALEIKSAVQTIHPDELKSALTNAQNVFRFLSAAMEFTRATAKQGSSNAEA